MVEKSKDINGLVIGQQQLPLGWNVSTGSGIYMLWAAWACLVASVAPYMIRSVSLPKYTYALADTCHS